MWYWYYVTVHHPQGCYVRDYRDAFNSVQFGIELGVALEKLFPGKMVWSENAKLPANKEFLAAVARAQDPPAIEQMFAADTEGFRVRRRKYLLY